LRSSITRALALLYTTLHDALGFRIETADIAIGKLSR